MNYGKYSIRKRQADADPTGVKVRNKIVLTICKLLIAATVVLGVIGISSGLGVMQGIIDSAPDISKIDVVPTGYTTTVLSSDGQEIATLVASGAHRKYVTLDEIPLHLQHAFVAVEDARFYEHNGIDLKGIVRAFASGVKSGEFSQGASTITQQLIKNNVLTEWVYESSFIESLQRKIQEQYLAIQLEKQVNDKDWILENYMNTINLGANTLGVETASERYFGKDVSELTLSECAVIAGITKNPYRYNPIRFPEKNKKRRDKVLKDMKEQGYITQAEYDEALNDDVYSRIAEHSSFVESSSSVNSYFVDALIDDVFHDLVNVLGYSDTDAYKAIYRGGLTICSSQDLALQKICDEEVNNLDNYPSEPEYSFSMSFQVKKPDDTFEKYTHQTMLSYYKKVNNNNDYSINYESEEACYAAIEEYKQAMLAEGGSIVEGSETVTISLQPQVAMTVIDQSTGEVKALVGGRGTKESDRTWNRATNMTRQPGSTFKIVACFAPALDSGLATLATTQVDEPYTVGKKTYKNAGNNYRGLTNIRSAITHSINIVTVKTLQDIGVGLGYKYAEDFGFTTLCEGDKNLGLSLGGLTKGVSNLELTASYACIANQGEYIQPSFYTTVLDHNGNVILDRSVKERRQVLQPTTAYLLTNAMKDVMTAGTGRRAFFGDSMPQAGKSGTTTSNRDSLFAGYTPYYTTVVWGGNDDNSKQSNSQTTYTKEIWKATMKRMHEGLGYKNFEIPAGIQAERVCKKSGLLATTYCEEQSEAYTESFAAGTLPTESCAYHEAPPPEIPTEEPLPPTDEQVPPVDPPVEPPTDNPVAPPQDAPVDIPEVIPEDDLEILEDEVLDENDWTEPEIETPITE